MSRAGKTIRINKPLYLWIIVSTLQIIQSRLAIVVVPTIPNRIQIRNISAYGKNIPPGVIGIAAIALPPVGDDGHNIALEIQNVVVGSTVIFQCIGLPGVVIDEIHDVVAPGLPDNLPVLGDVVVGYAVDRGISKLPLGAAGGLDLRHCSGFHQSINFRLLLTEADMVVYFPHLNI